MIVQSVSFYRIIIAKLEPDLLLLTKTEHHYVDRYLDISLHMTVPLKKTLLVYFWVNNFPIYSFTWNFLFLVGLRETVMCPIIDAGLQSHIQL